MRAVTMVLLVLTTACGASKPKPPPPNDDLELERTLEVRKDWAARVTRGELGNKPEPGPDAGTGTPTMRVELVEETRASPTADKRIDLAVRDADVRDVLRMIAVAAGVNLVASDDVSGEVTLEVRNVTWRQAIDVIAHLEGLTVLDQDGIVSVTRTGRGTP